ncbi:Enhancer of filamentation 1 [Acipenser ruthenus]|uniref:Breast cancer anti-estrogen resistance protein 1 n=1 Tax=Acipenser ruthenus TaxID=7906 RepID=A0A444U628_ACIRT|nr:Enhancer of filamentation 1 [Acipenser ruthenus]
MVESNLMAKALYDNVPESPEELAFRKGDILTVIEQNTGGLEGWWLCSLHGRQGIAPGNRLKLLIGPMFDSHSPNQTTTTQSSQQQGYPASITQNSSFTDSVYQVPPCHQNQQSIYQVPPSHSPTGKDIYQVPPSVQRSIWGTDGLSSKVVTPVRVGQGYAYESLSRICQQDVYDVPPIRPQGVVTPVRVGQGYAYESLSRICQQDVYDVPPIRPQGVYDIPPTMQKGPMSPGQMGDPRAQGVYDIPPSTQGVYSTPLQREGNYDFPPPMRNKAEGVYDVPPPSIKPQGHSNYDFPPSSDMVPCNNKGIYDIPPPHLLGHQLAAQKDVYDIPRGMQLPGKQNAAGDRLAPEKGEGIYDVPPQVYSTPLQREGNYDFPPPMRNKAEGVYDVPPPSIKPQGHSNYDFPPSSDMVPCNNKGIYDIPPPHLLGHQLAAQKDVYDIPRGMQLPGKQNAAGDRLAPEKGEGIYDVPPQVLQDSKGFLDVTDGMNRLSFSSTGSTRSNMSTSSTTSKESSISTTPTQENKLLLDLDTAIQRVSWLQQSIELSVSGLVGYVAPNWRSYEYMEKHANEIHVAVDKVKQNLTDFLNFSKGATANASGLSDLPLYTKLKKQLQRLEDSNQILTQTSHALDGWSWSLNVLATNKPHNKCDDLDRFIMVARTVPDDVKQLASSVSTNAELLFQRSPCGLGLNSVNDLRAEDKNSKDYIYSSPQPHLGKEDKTVIQCRALSGLADTDQKSVSAEKCVKSWMEDYDYVHLQGKEEFERQQKELLEKENIIKQNKVQLEQEQLNQFKQLEKEVIKPVENDISMWSTSQNIPQMNGGQCAKDKQLLFFYSEQCETHFVTFLNAIDAFFSCISAGQPPRIFVAHSKFVILSAHKLVFIGDTLSRQTSTLEIRNKVMNCSNILCEHLKSIVSSTKMAALHYPSTAAVQDMVDRVTDLSHHAQQFKGQLLQMASM